MGKATSAIRGISRSQKESQDIKRAEENVEALQQQLEEVEQDLKQEIEAIAIKWDPQGESLETITIRPKKSNISPQVVGLGWAPYWENAKGSRTPAWE